MTDTVLRIPLHGLTCPECGLATLWQESSGTWTRIHHVASTRPCVVGTGTAPKEARQ